jgi:hypothetical protein
MPLLTYFIVRGCTQPIGLVLLQAKWRLLAFLLCREIKLVQGDLGRHLSKAATCDWSPKLLCWAQHHPTCCLSLHMYPTKNPFAWICVREDDFAVCEWKRVLHPTWAWDTQPPQCAILPSLPWPSQPVPPPVVHLHCQDPLPGWQPCFTHVL